VIDGEALTPLIQQMPFTALTSGNHELYRDETMTHMVSSGFVASWGGRYITGNVFNATTGRRIGEPYAIVQGEQKTSVMVFGFLFNMENHCAAVDVRRVQDVVQEQWFLDAVDKAADKAYAISAIVVLGAPPALRPPLQRDLSSREARGYRPQRGDLRVAERRAARGARQCTWTWRTG